LGKRLRKTNACTMVVAKSPVTVSVVSKDMSNGLPSSTLSYKKSITSMSYKFLCKLSRCNSTSLQEELACGQILLLAFEV
jgi:hypothetical protein